MSGAIHARAAENDDEIVATAVAGVDYVARANAFIRKRDDENRFVYRNDGVAAVAFVGAAFGLFAWGIEGFWVLSIVICLVTALSSAIHVLVRLRRARFVPRDAYRAAYLRPPAAVGVGRKAAYFYVDGKLRVIDACAIAGAEVSGRGFVVTDRAGNRTLLLDDLSSSPAEAKAAADAITALADD